MMTQSWAKSAAAAACASMLVAGTASAGAWHVGARGGINVSSLRGDITDVVQPSWQVTPMVGGFMEGEVAPALNLGVEVNYIQKGAKFGGTGADDTGNPTEPRDTHLVLEYADVPILLRVLLPETGAVRPYIVAGPTFGFALKGTVRSKGMTDQNVSDDMKTLDLGSTAGVGVRIAAVGSRVDVEARYATSFTDLWDVSDNLGSINHGFSLTLAVSR
jgi:hypothetical protein